MAASYTVARASNLCLIARGSLEETIADVQKVAKDASIPVPSILGLQVDVADAQSVEAAAEKFKQRFPQGLDILVSNAGYLEPEKFVGDSDATEWSRSIDINLKGPYHMSRSFLPLLLAKQFGLKVICNVVSMGAHMILPGMSAYNIAKLATCRLTEYVASEYADKGIITFTLHPGGVRTDMGLKLPVDKQDAFLVDTAKLVSDTTVWLTAERRDWLTGRYTSVLWDMKELEAHSKEIVDSDLLKVKLMVGNGFLT
jgi:NAD(P)-dependent dehydrogenase (short-subunit alcohol dehydrogenase family)